MVQSRCGILCSECEFKDKRCKGCTNIEKPFWAEACPVKDCCEKKEKKHCGQCEVFPCSLLISFAYDKKQGDNGRRIEQLRSWEKEAENGIK